MATAPTKPKYILSFEDVRAVLGLSDEELPDSRLALPVFSTSVAEAVESVHPELETIYDSLKLKQETDPTTLTRTERKIVNLTEVYATYRMAKLLLVGMRAGTMKRITDGKAEVERFQVDIESLLEEIDAMLADLLARLLSALEDYGLTVEVPAPTYLLGTATLGVDPVTGE